MRKQLLIILMSLMAGFLLAGCIAPLPFSDSTGTAGTAGTGQEQETEPVEQPITLSISCVGDVMVHSTQFKAQYDADTDTYQFDNNFQYVKDYISAADLALLNLETTLSGPPYAGYPAFRSPDSLADALDRAGFDVALLSNNHILDGGVKGLERTLGVLTEKGFQVSGAQLPEGKPFAIVDVKGVKTAILSYTYETPSIEGRHALNGNPMSDTALSMTNTFLYEDLSSLWSELSAQIQQAKEEGAQIIVCYLHWGEEYQREPNRWQTEMAQQLSDLGVDIVFASHPHVLQPYKLIRSEASGKTTAVFYSMGNFLSNQRLETLDNRYTEQGMIAQVEVTLMQSTGEILSIQQSAVPTWVDKYKKDGKNVYAIVPLVDGLADNPSLAVSGHLTRAQQALEDVNGLFTEN